MAYRARPTAARNVAIYKRRAEGASIGQLSREFGVSVSRLRGIGLRAKDLTSKRDALIFSRYGDGETMCSIAHHMGLSVSAIGRIIRREYRRICQTRKGKAAQR